MDLEANASLWILSKCIYGFCHKCHICSELYCNKYLAGLGRDLKHLRLVLCSLQPVDLGLAVSVPRGTALPYGCNEVYVSSEEKIGGVPLIF